MWWACNTSNAVYVRVCILAVTENTHMNMITSQHTAGNELNSNLPTSQTGNYWRASWWRKKKKSVWACHWIMGFITVSVHPECAFIAKPCELGSQYLHLPPQGSRQRDTSAASSPSSLWPERRSQRGTCTWSQTWPRPAGQSGSPQTQGRAVCDLWRSRLHRRHSGAEPHNPRSREPAGCLHRRGPAGTERKVRSDESHSTVQKICIFLKKQNKKQNQQLSLLH